MPLSPHMSRKIQETMGPEAGEKLMTWMSNVDDLRADVAELRHQMDVKFLAMDARFAALENLLNSRLEQQTLRIEALIERRSVDVIKWSFVFWVSAVGALAALAGVLN